MADHQFGIIGGGNMAEAILRGVLAASVINRNTVIVSEPKYERRQFLTRELQIKCVDDNLAAAACPRILLAVKPQMMGEVLLQAARNVAADATVISIAAGISTAFLDQRLGERGHIIRTMPNTPMLVSAGMTAIAPGPRATRDEVLWAEKLFSACGKVVTVPERMMDAVTAISGSGPAYVFYLIEAMIAAGAEEGLPPDTAAMLATETAAGAVKLLAESRERPEVLRLRVTSPGGTTQAAISCMDNAGVKGCMVAAIRAAAARSRELGK
jgi:pyrroline-5-carboxylate reductase